MPDAPSSQLDAILLHVGYAKCASSWLQKYVFTSQVGFVCPWPSFDNRAAEEFIHMQRGPFDVERVRRDFARDLAAAQAPACRPVISYETLTGDPTRGLFDGYEAARRLHAAFPRAQVLICVREQVSYLYSAWTEYVRRGGTWGLDRFAPIKPARSGYSAICRADLLAFGELVAWYVELFGRERVLCLPMELLVSDPDGFRGRLADFTAIPAVREVNTERHYPGLGGVTIRWQRLLNHFAPRDPLDWADQRRYRVVRRLRNLAQRGVPAAWHRRAKQKAVDGLKEAIGRRYADSNRKLQAFVDVDLRELGYAMGEAVAPRPDEE